MSNDPSESISTSSTMSLVVASLHDQIASQRAEIERLQSREKSLEAVEEIVGKLSKSLMFAKISSPNVGDPLLLKIVEAAAQIIPSPSASLLLVDEEANDLVFAVATGHKSDDVKTIRVPIGHGVAGMVAATGQAMIINDALYDTRQASDIADQIGYKPRKLMCVPLVSNERVIGVLELLDNDAGYVRDDIETLSMFSELCAIALELSSVRRGSAKVAAESIASLIPGGVKADDVKQQLGSLFSAASDSIEYQRALDISEYVVGIGRHGERATESCRALLREFHDYLHKTSSPRN